MKREDYEKIVEQAEEHAKPIDFESLVEDGALMKIGKSYYIKDLKKIPKIIRSRITSLESTPKGMKAIFAKETKHSEKAAKELRKILEP